jgi:3-oxoacyl-[acyl-carrier protein] reductase
MGSREGAVLEGQVVLVTGGAQGIGRYISQSFARAGARVAVADIGSTDKVVGELQDLTSDAMGVKADVRNEADVKSMVDQVVEKFGQIDVLVNNAGIVPHFQWGTPKWPKVRDMEQSFWDRVLGTNLGGTFLSTKHVLPHMESRRSGHIISLHGGGGPGACAYVVSKEAIVVFTKFVAEEEREHGICIVAMGPGGAIATETAPEEARQRMAGVDSIGDRFVLGAQVDMSLSGKLLDLKDGRLQPTNYLGPAAPVVAPAPLLLVLKIGKEPDVDDRRHSILVVEDDPTMTEMLRILLEDSGYHILTATHGEEALDLAREQPPDLVTLDLGLPGMDGREVLRRFRSDPLTMHLPIIVVSAKHFEPSPEESVDAVLTKPFDVTELDGIVERLLGLTT